MAVSVVGGAPTTFDAGGTATTSPSITLDQQATSGNMLIVSIANHTIGDPVSGDLVSNYTLLDTNNYSTTSTTAVYYKIAAGTETTVSWSYSGPRQCAAQVHELSGWHGTTPPEISVATDGLNDSPDPNSLTPSGWSAGAEDTFWLFVTGMGDDMPTVSSYPTNYTGGAFAQSDGGTNDSASIATAYRTLAAASENPGALTLSEIEGWSAYVVAVRPGEAASGGTAAFGGLTSSGGLAGPGGLAGR